MHRARLMSSRPSWWSQLVLVVGFLFAYDQLRAWHGNVVGVAVHNGREVLSVDRWLHVAWSQPMDTWLAGHATAGILLAGYYVVMHLGATTGMLLALFLWSPAYRRHRNALLILSLLALIVFWVYPTAPPRLLPGFHDTVRHDLPFAYQAETDGANLYAAMPSLHVAWAVWVAVSVRALTARKWVRLLAALHPVATAVSVLATGNHYMLDVLAGAALTPVGYLVLGVGERLRHRFAVGSAHAVRRT
ncbi:MAG TPA: phosphatase PAP2 family protein [Mycobacteriales bacterium]|nr:phosphatase PAP2 family protein [Mycobacteriales bacterium]